MVIIQELSGPEICRYVDHLLEKIPKNVMGILKLWRRKINIQIYDSAHIAIHSVLQQLCYKANLIPMGLGALNSRGYANPLIV